jgi:hypothetical protein
VHKHMRTHGSEGATEPGRDVPGPVDQNRPAWPTPGVGSAPFSCTRRTFNPKFVEAPPFERHRGPFAPRGHPQARERRGRSSEKDLSTRRKHPQVEKREDNVGSVTMINGAMSSTLMG